ncbi:MAG: hypothetical protein EYC62_09430 [Alphaproteobacteria bacterium]|nr:MAG: hypothetical protein EYC62_09430 [Alphaproteobacteria bacterium]
MKRIYQVSVLAMLAVISACAAPNLTSERLDSGAAYDMQQTLMGAQNLDMSHVYTVRMLVNGTRVDVTSLSPEVIGLEGQEKNRYATVLVFSQNRDSVIFFTRDPETGEGYRRSIGLNELRQRPVFEFPLVVGTTVTTAKFEVIDVTVLP